MLKQTRDKINGRFHVIKSSTIYQVCVDSVFWLYNFKWRWIHYCELTLK